MRSLRERAAAETGVERPTLAVDGKTLRLSHDRKKGLGTLHSVTVWASEYDLSLGQVACGEQSNEITAIPDVTADETLGHLAGLENLRKLEIHLDHGEGEGLRHLAGLRSLRHLRLLGEGKVGGTLRHLEGLKGLRSLEVAAVAGTWLPGE